MRTPKRLSPFLLALTLATAPLRSDADPLLSVVPLEQDRVGPGAPLKPLALETQPGKADYFLYNYSLQEDPTTPILYLRIPFEYVGEVSKSVHKFGVHFTCLVSGNDGFAQPGQQAAEGVSRLL
ncbi:hypothetical protein JDN40_09495 [Rhodomicrobium vannielii ATCC 17100]|uniref:hypothetical protein n=1 Tax=Rhodomicrobium vannielii TaxID=1069 RepID=UPI00191AB999|nr:hypothetical protein [Rhodomicrobium vannielii]MBJ7534336.1 hypothetical protein [Rhodomicrobium vannielii ATCC 17100]